MNGLPAPKTVDACIRRIGEHDPETLEAIAALTGFTLEGAKSFALEHATQIDVETTLARLEGRNITPKAFALVSSMLDMLREKLGDGSDFDAEEIANLMKYPLRILEGHQREKLAARDNVEKLPVFVFNIGRSHEPSQAIEVSSREVDDGHR